jgi:hypothetical protein
LIKKNWMTYFRLGWGRFKKSIKTMKTASDDK